MCPCDNRHVLDTLRRFISRHLLWAFLLLGSAACLCGPDPGPSPDSCEAPFEGRLVALEVGSVSEQIPEALGQMWPQTDGEFLFIVQGGQGADMIGLRFGTRGGGDPSCVRFMVDAKQSGQTIASREVALNTYPAAEGRVTHTLWLPGNFNPGPLELTVTAGALTRTLTLSAVGDSSCQDANACPCALALNCRPWQSAGECERSLSARAVTQYGQALACAAQYCPTRDAGTGAEDGGMAADGGGDDGGVVEVCDEECRQCRANVFDTFSCSGGTQTNCGVCADVATTCLLSPP